MTCTWSADFIVVRWGKFNMHTIKHVISLHKQSTLYTFMTRGLHMGLYVHWGLEYYLWHSGCKLSPIMNKLTGYMPVFNAESHMNCNSLHCWRQLDDVATAMVTYTWPTMHCWPYTDSLLTISSILFLPPLPKSTSLSHAYIGSSGPNYNDGYDKFVNFCKCKCIRRTWSNEGSPPVRGQG
jgi:hypothetical protein